MNKFRWLAVALLLPLLVACAGSGSSTRAPLTDEEQLQTRSVERWQLLIGGKADQAWEYLSPGYRSTRSREEYVVKMSGRSVTWQGAEFDSLKCHVEARFCEVAVKVRFQVVSRQIGVGQIGADTYVTERWVKVGGAWFHVPEDVSG